MNFRQNRIRKTKKMVRGVLVVLFLAVLLGGPLNHVFSGISVSISAYFLRAVNFTDDWLESNMAVFFKDKLILEKENKFLKERINQLKTDILSYQVLEKENRSLKEILLRTEEDKYVVGFVLSRPPQSPYDVFIVDIGMKSGVKNGMEVTAYGDILIGHVSEVFSKTSKVKLVSFPKEEIGAMILSSNMPVIAIGQGNGNLEINLPKDAEITEGDKIVTIGAEPMILGIVERVESQPTDPFQKILFRLPINIQELAYVMIKI